MILPQSKAAMTPYESYDMIARGNTLMSHYATAITIISTYLLLVKMLLPQYMKDKKPLSLKAPIAVYNLAQVIMNTHIVYECFSLMGISLIYFWSNICNPVSAVNNGPEISKQIYDISYYYYFIKIIDLFDTICFSLRKKKSQITFLHVSHHIIALGLSWVTLVHMREELSMRFIAINSGVHILMYLYYFLSGLGHSVQKYLWWKKHLTTVQIVQFVTGISMCAKLKLEDCSCHPWFPFTWTFAGTYFLVLFLNFYKQSYSSAKKQM